jgi:hypothetical protein
MTNNDRARFPPAEFIGGISMDIFSAWLLLSVSAANPEGEILGRFPDKATCYMAGAALLPISGASRAVCVPLVSENWDEWLSQYLVDQL